MADFALRFLIGGCVVTIFALLGEVLRPKSFAGLSSAAPSVALASLGLTVHQHGNAYAAIESRSMLLGAAGFLLYAVVVSRLLIGRRMSSIAATLLCMPIWFAASFGLFWALLLRGAQR